MQRMCVPVLVSVSLAVACGGPLEGPGAAPASDGASAPRRANREVPTLEVPRGSPSVGLHAPFGLSRAVQDQGLGLATWLIRSALAARGYTPDDRPPTTGTIGLYEAGIVYRPVPTDVLRVETAGGAWTFEVVHAHGDDGSVTSFFQDDHRLRFVVRDDAGTDLEITSTRDGIRRQARVAGRMPRHREIYDVDVTWVGEEVFDIDGTGTGFRSRLAVAGWIEGVDLKLDVSEGWRFELVSSPGGFVAQTAERALDGGVIMGGHSYGFRNIETRRAFRDGQPTELDTYWSAHGAVLEDGEPWGEVAFSPRIVETASGGFVQFVLQTPSGEELLEQHLVY